MNAVKIENATWGRKCGAQGKRKSIKRFLEGTALMASICN